MILKSDFADYEGCTCSSSELRHDLEVHSEGKAIVFTGDFGECLLVSAVLEEINLGTQIEY